MKKPGLVCFVILCTFAVKAQIVHQDPYDIKTANVSLLMSYRLQGLAFHARVSQYLGKRMSITAVTYLGLSNRYKPNYQQQYFVPQGGLKNLIQLEGEADYHLVDRSKEKDVHVTLRSFTSGNTRTVTYTTMPTTVRRIFAISAGVQSYAIAEKLYDRDSKHPFLWYSISEQKDVKPNSSEIDPGSGAYVTKYEADVIYTNASYVNVLIGFKMKAINAAAIRMEGYGKRTNAQHMETYFDLILPVSHSFDEEMYEKEATAPSYRVHDAKPKMGWKVGLITRNSIAFWSTMGAEFGVQPSMKQANGKGFFFNFTLGYNIGWPKIKDIE